MKHRRIRGIIKYESLAPDSYGHLRGIERFYFTLHQDGSKTIRTISELEIPEPKLLRDVISGYEPDGSVRDTLLRVSVDDKLLGTAWYFSDGRTIELEGWSPATGRIRDSRLLDDDIEGLCTHPVFNDGYIFRALDVSRGPHKRNVKYIAVSADVRGATPPQLATMTTGMEYVGDDMVSVPAGDFECHHFRIAPDDIVTDGAGVGSLEMHIWVTKNDWVYVKGETSGAIQSRYQLIEYEEIV